MRMKRKIAFLFSIGIGAVILSTPFPKGGWAASPSPPEYPSCDSFGIQKFPKAKSAPAFSLKSLNGGKVSLSEFKGKPVLITFWATWCTSCKEELPELEKFSIGKKDQLAIVLITIDGEREGAAQKIVSENKITLPVLLLLKEKVMDQYGVMGWIPITFLVNQEGMLVGKLVGQRDWGTPEAWSCLKELFELR